MNSQALSPALSVDQPFDQSLRTIEGIDEPIIDQYFATLNAGEFKATAALFAPDGILHPPFETPVVGQEAIAAYLHQEASGIILHPKQGTARVLENGCTEYQITGKVQTALFVVNVAWTLILSAERKIFVARVNLLATLKELASLRDRTQRIPQN